MGFWRIIPRFPKPAPGKRRFAPLKRPKQPLSRMPMNRVKLFVLFAVLGALPALLTAQPVAENKLPPAHAKKGDDPFLNGAPFTFDQMLKLVGDSPIPIRRRKDAIQARGIDFAGTPDELDKLKAAGAADDMLELIKSKAKVSTV